MHDSVEASTVNVTGSVTSPTLRGKGPRWRYRSPGKSRPGDAAPASRNGAARRSPCRPGNGKLRPQRGAGRLRSQPTGRGNAHWRGDYTRRGTSERDASLHYPLHRKSPPAGPVVGPKCPGTTASAKAVDRGIVVARRRAQGCCHDRLRAGPPGVIAGGANPRHRRDRGSSALGPSRSHWDNMLSIRAGRPKGPCSPSEFSQRPVHSRASSTPRDARPTRARSRRSLPNPAARA